MWHKLLILLLAAAGAALLPSLSAAQEGANRAGLVVRFGDGRVVQACVSFAEESLSGEDLLARSGLPVIAQPSGIGAAVCKIGDEGCDYPAQDCFCKCTGADCAYWALSRLEGDAWRYSSLGASSVQVRNGDVQGWAWGAGGAQGGAAPPMRSFAQLCEVEPAPEPATAAPPTAPPPPTPRPTRPPPTAPAPSATSAPTAQATATSDPAPTEAPSATAPPTAAPTEPATSTATAAATPTASPEAVAALPAPTSPPADAGQAAQSEPVGGPPAGYIALAALVGALLAGFGVVAWRRRQ
jgi:hypothetical protein